MERVLTRPSPVAALQRYALCVSWGVIRSGLVLVSGDNKSVKLLQSRETVASEHPLGGGSPSSETLRGEYSRQLRSDLVKSSAICFAFFVQDPGYFRGGSHLRFRVLLKLQIHHLLDQFYRTLRIHKYNLLKLYINRSPESHPRVPVMHSSHSLRAS